MDLSDIVPIEYRGMSVFTLLIFFFFMAGAGVWWNILKREFKRIYTILDEHDGNIDTQEKTIAKMHGSVRQMEKELSTHSKKIDEWMQDMGDMKIDIALTLQSVKNIEKMLEQKH